MQTGRVALDELVRALDEVYALDEWDADPTMSRWVARVYARIGCDCTRILEPRFCRRYNGLMLRSAAAVRSVYCAAFPTPEIVGRVLAAASGEALLFLHHPIDMEVAGVGFLPVPPGDLARLQAAGVSVYACHAPMDYHDEVGTNAAIVEALGAKVEERFARHGGGYAGRICAIAPSSLGALAAHGQGIFGVDRVVVGGASPDLVNRIAIVAGGGDEPEFFAEAEQAGAQAYITGEWYTRTTPPDEEGRRWAEGNRAACLAYAHSSGMAFLGFSHAASEFLVMKRQMAPWFERWGLRATAVTQSDWWR